MLRHSLCRPVGRSCRPLNCRHDADETPHHGPTRLSTVRHQARAKPWIVQHNRTRRTTRKTIPSGFLNLVSLVRFQPGAPNLPAYGDCCFGRSAGFLPKRQDCRHSADETGRHSPARFNSAADAAAPLPEESAGTRRPKATTEPERFVCAGCGNRGYAVFSRATSRPGPST